MIVQEHSPTVEKEILEPLVQSATGYPNLQVQTWQVTNLSRQGRRSIFRFAGVGHDGAASRSWSLILKVIGAPENADAPDTDMRHCFYWPRESLVYAAGIPQSLTGALRAPHCLGVMQPDSNTRWIWLEELQDRYDGHWPVERYSLAAHHLGVFNGSYLVDKSMPTAPWLTNNGLRSRSADAVASLEKFLDPTVWKHPLLRRAFPTPVLDELVRLVADHQRFLAAAAHLPQTFCHLDAWHGNMAAMTDANGAEVTVLFDWAAAGYAAVGQEISNLIWSSLLEFKIDIHDAEQLEANVFNSYLQGLTQAGWSANERQVRIAYLISSVLLFGLAPEAVEHALNETEHKALERHYDWAIERIVEQAAQVTYRLLERADELRALLGALSILK